MTTIVTRLYETREAAERVADTLRSDGFPEATLSIVTKADPAAMKEARVEEHAAETYAAAMKSGQALFVCRAPFVPFGAARRAIEVADSEPARDVGVETENRHEEEIAELEKDGSSVLTQHPLMLTREDYAGSGWSGWRLSDALGWPTVSRRRERPRNLASWKHVLSPRDGAVIRSGHSGHSVIPGGRHMSRVFWPMPLVRTGNKKSILEDHPKISERLGFPTLLER